MQQRRRNIDTDKNGINRNNMTASHLAGIIINPTTHITSKNTTPATTVPTIPAPNNPPTTIPPPLLLNTSITPALLHHPNINSHTANPIHNNHNHNQHHTSLPLLPLRFTPIPTLPPNPPSTNYPPHPHHPRPPLRTQANARIMLVPRRRDRMPRTLRFSRGDSCGGVQSKGRGEPVKTQSRSSVDGQLQQQHEVIPKPSFYIFCS